MLTNSTQIIEYARKADSVTLYIYRCAHDASEVPLITVDFLIFGEHLSSCPDDGDPLFNVSSDALDQLADFHD
jgi:hypothetical protein